MRTSNRSSRFDREQRFNSNAPNSSYRGTGNLDYERDQNRSNTRSYEDNARSYAENYGSTTYAGNNVGERDFDQPYARSNGSEREYDREDRWSGNQKNYSGVGPKG